MDFFHMKMQLQKKSQGLNVSSYALCCTLKWSWLGNGHANTFRSEPCAQPYKWMDGDGRNKCCIAKNKGKLNLVEEKEKSSL